MGCPEQFPDAIKRMNLCQMVFQVGFSRTSIVVQSHMMTTNTVSNRKIHAALEQLLLGINCSCYGVSNLSRILYRYILSRSRKYMVLEI